MATKNTVLTLPHRVWALGLNVATFYVAHALAAGTFAVHGNLESVWILSATALWFLTLLSSPWFLPPRDVIANAITAASILVSMSTASVTLFHEPLEVTRWAALGYAVAVAVISVIALVLHSQNPDAPSTHLTFALTNIFGRGEILYTPAALISILGSYQNNYAAIASLVLLWTFFIIARPWERILLALYRFRTEKASDEASSIVGIIERIDHPDIVRVRLTGKSTWKAGSLYTASMSDGDQSYVLGLFTQIQGTEVMGTGLRVASASTQDTNPLTVGRVRQSHDQEKTAQFIEKLSGTKGAKLIGFTVENSTINTIRFEVAMSTTLEEGETIFARINSQDIFYQILDAETSEESFDQNPRGTHIVRAAQIGSYDSMKGFTKYPWLPAMNSPLFTTKSREFQPPVHSAREFILADLPSAKVGVVANIDNLIEYHTAILGVTGTGKTELALDMIREAVKRDAKVFCVDFTGDYRHRLADLSPTFLGPSPDDGKNLERCIFAVETGKYGAPDEKQKLNSALAALQETASGQISEFLEGAQNSLAIFELSEIANTKATLRLTELYLSAIMEWARAHRRARSVMIVLEEAHTIIPEVYGSGFDSATQWVVSRIGQIALQGRKYGVGLVVVTQRTALVSKTILSQCNTFFTHSLIDQTSLNFLESVYSSQHTRLIPNLGRFEFLAFGKGIRAERPLVLRREFDPSKEAASKALHHKLEENTAPVPAEENPAAPNFAEIETEHG